MQGKRQKVEIKFKKNIYKRNGNTNHFPQANTPSFRSINMSFNFNSKMDTSPHFQKFPNPNPNFDQVAPATRHDQLNDVLYFHDISNYLMSDEGLEDSVLPQNKNVSENITNCSDESSNSIPVAHNIKCRRIVKKYQENHEFRLAFRTKSDLEFMDDGFKWRKYGKKMVKSSPNPRNYFKCSNGGCSVKKRVERDREDSSYVITTYEGVHNHATPNCVLYCSPQSISL